MKKVITSSTAITLVTVPAGSERSISKSEASAPCGMVSTRSAAPVLSSRIAVPPMTQNQITVAPLGTSSTPIRNCRTVRPREMRAMKVPTKGAQDSHQAQ